MKYLLWNKKKSQYFVKYEGQNKPIWTDNKLEAAQYEGTLALRMKKRLACQSQVVSLVIAEDEDYDEAMIREKWE